ncbi:hypothetical protein [Alteribacter natronophilus]|uniref:hypothetical protein n=1 Tax=Alteribacter natronophilus TaxID=2583810 RepID=UPI00110E1757|nr:hypothetical protein [Alteribacter natronophilus]TMW72919.1 hypothetical protein FGB90_00990 [Alteribacter natronophilus]
MNHPVWLLLLMPVLATSVIVLLDLVLVGNSFSAAVHFPFFVLFFLAGLMAFMSRKPGQSSRHSAVQ